MSDCEFCRVLQEKKNIVYEDEVLAVIVPERPATKGHFQIISKNHNETMQDIESKDLEHMFYAASFAATSLFENLGAEGTNIIANTGGELKKGGHFHIDAICRKQGDGLNFLWQPNKIPEEEMKSIQAKIKDNCDLIGHARPEQEVIDLDNKKIETIGAVSGDSCKEKSAEKKNDIDNGNESYLIRQMRRLP